MFLHSFIRSFIHHQTPVIALSGASWPKGKISGICCKTIHCCPLLCYASYYLPLSQSVTCFDVSPSPRRLDLSPLSLCLCLFSAAKTSWTLWPSLWWTCGPAWSCEWPKAGTRTAITPRTPCTTRDELWTSPHQTGWYKKKNCTKVAPKLSICR